MLIQVAAHGTITNANQRRVSGTSGEGCLGSILDGSITNRLASQEKATPTCVLATWSLKAAAVCVRMCVCVWGGDPMSCGFGSQKHCSSPDLNQVTEAQDLCSITLGLS
jgi:hypothetical protein